MHVYSPKTAQANHLVYSSKSALVIPYPMQAYSVKPALVNLYPMQVYPSMHSKSTPYPTHRSKFHVQGFIQNFLSGRGGGGRGGAGGLRPNFKFVTFSNKTLFSITIAFPMPTVIFDAVPLFLETSEAYDKTKTYVSHSVKNLDISLIL